MATIKVVLRKKKLLNGGYPLAIRITHDRKSSFIHLGQYLNENDWDDKNQRVKKSHDNSKWLNALISKKLGDARNKSLELETTKPTITAKAVSKKIKPKSGGTVFTVSNKYIDQLKKDGKYNRWNSEKSYVKHLQEFLKTDIPFSDLTISILERYKPYLVTTYKMSERSAVNHLVNVRSIFSFAIKDGACDKKQYPFGKEGIKIKFPESTKVGLSAEDVKKIEDLELNEVTNHARNLWLISYYFAGMRASDLLRLKWSDIHDGRLYYTMGKNSKADSLKLSGKVTAILTQYEAEKQGDSDLIFQDLRKVDLGNKFETDRIIASRINSIDKLLRTVVAPAAKIRKKLTLHVSRHTFATLAGDKIPLQMLQKLYRHSRITTTIGYQANFIHQTTDDALEAVIGL